MSFMGLKCWTKGEHQISKLQLQLVYVHCTRYEIPSVLWRQSMPIAITHFSHFPRQTWRQLPKSHIAACITYIFATILYWGNIPTCWNSTICCNSTNTVTICCNTYKFAVLQHCKTAAMQKLQSPGARTVRSVWAGPSTVGKANACYGGLRSDETNMLCNFSSFTFTLDQDMYAWKKWLPCQIQMLSDYFVCCAISRLWIFIQIPKQFVSAHLFWNFARAAEPCCVENFLN